METVNINTFIQNIEENIDAIEAGTLAPDTCLRELPAWDSLAVLSMLAMVDAEFGVQITGTEINDCGSITEVLEVIHSKQG